MRLTARYRGFLNLVACFRDIFLFGELLTLLFHRRIQQMIVESQQVWPLVNYSLSSFCSICSRISQNLEESALLHLLPIDNRGMM